MIVSFPEKKITFARVKYARSFFDRLIGLIRYRKPPLFIMVFEHCKMIHTFGMAYPIDVVFLTKDGVVVHIGTVQRNDISSYVRNGYYCLEAPARFIGPLSLRVGDVIQIQKKDPC